MSIFNRDVAVTSPQSGTIAAKCGLPACSARASALAAAERLPVIHWKNILKRFEPKTVSKIAGRAQREIFIGIWGTRERAVAAAILNVNA